MSTGNTLRSDVDEVVVLVDDNGVVLGTAPKLEAHQPPGHLHLAVSVVLVDGEGKLLLQRRAASKYHFPSYWSNACCSHPRPGEAPAVAARRRLVEELGLDVELYSAGSFIYRATCPTSGLIEHELDHVFVGTFDEEPRPAEGEVDELCRVTAQSLQLGTFAGPLTPWLAQATEIALDAWADYSSRAGGTGSGRAPF